VQRADGSAFAGAWVQLDVPPFGQFKWEQISRSFERGKKADAEGRYEFGHLRGGSYQLSVNGVGKQELELKAGEERVVDLAQASHGRLRGRITRAGQPAAVDLELSGDTADGEPVGNIPDGKTDADGRYELELRGPATYTLAAKTEGFASTFSKIEVQGPGDATLDVELPAGSIAGRIVRDTDHAPLADAEVEVIRDGTFVMGWSTSAADGSFSVGGLPAGNYAASFNGYVAAEGFGRRPGFVPVQHAGLVLTEGQALAGVELAACPGARLSGAVTLPGGVPARDGCAIDLVLQRDGKIVPWPSHAVEFTDDPYMKVCPDTDQTATVSTEHGRYEFVALPAGSYFVAVRSGDEALAADVVARGAAITVPEHGDVTVDLVAPP
jgi:hypothetical protein